jgi:hypothetical protein
MLSLLRKDSASVRWEKFRKKLIFLAVVAASCFTAMPNVQIYITVFSISAAEGVSGRLETSTC